MDLLLPLALTLLSLSTPSLSTFSPTDNHLINCGSTATTVLDPDHRHFTGDSQNAPFLSSTHTTSFSYPNPDPGLSPIYHTARVFKAPSKYSFDVKDKGTHLVRLHFHQLDSAACRFGNPLFHVSVNGFLLLGNFSGYETQNNALNSNPRVIREYMIWVDSERVEIVFTPSKRSNFAYVNAIEVISAPKDLIPDFAQFVGSGKVEKFDGLLSKQALETVYRVNVGGPKVTPFNDSLWRTWVPDNEFLNSNDGSLERVYFSGRIKYQIAGASREVAPDNVYNSARLIRSKNDSIPNYNMTWSFRVSEGYKYLVRMHFCDIASISLELLTFNVYVNGYLAYEDLDLSYVVNEILASPFYADFVVDGGNSGVLSVSVGPSSKSCSYCVDAILNGVEIMKMNNSMGSLDGEVSVEMVLKSWPRRKFCALVPLVAVLCLLLAASMVMRRRRIWVKDSVAWLQLPTDVSEVNLKGGNEQSSGKSGYF